MFKIDKKSKPSGHRDNLISWRLKNMAGFAEELASSGWDKKAQASNNRYIRIGGESVRMVSLDDASALNHCGRNYTTIVNCIKNEQPPEHLETTSKNGKKSVFESKKERRLQAHIIKTALMSNDSLLDKSLFKCLKDGELLDELVFLTDEISFGDKNHGPTIRCDLFALGQLGEETFPVMIELKSTRSLDGKKNGLIQQLKDAEKEITTHAEEADQLSRAITPGKGFSHPKKCMKILVWPKAESNPRKDTLEKIKDAGIIAIEYCPKDFETQAENLFSILSPRQSMS